MVNVELYIGMYLIFRKYIESDMLVLKLVVSKHSLHSGCISWLAFPLIVKVTILILAQAVNMLLPVIVVILYLNCKSTKYILRSTVASS